MPRKKLEDQPESRAIPAKQDQNEILEEVGAQLDEDSNEMMASEARVLEIGAVDVDAVRDNRRRTEYVNKKRGGDKGVAFNTDDVLQRYEALIAFWPPNTIDISIRRLTGTPVQHVITSRPRSAVELYAAVSAVHGQHSEAEYELKFQDTSRKAYRGTGRITMPDTRGQQGQPMNYPYPPPPGYPPQMASTTAPAYPQGYPSAPGAPHASAPAAAGYPSPPVVVQPQMPDIGAMMGMFQQVFDMAKSMQPAPPPVAAMPPPPPMMPPMPPPGADVNTQMAWMAQAFELFQRMSQPQAGAAGSVASAPNPAPPAANAMAAFGMPPMQPPPGTMWVPGFGFIPVDRLMQAIGAETPGRAPPFRRPPYSPPQHAADERSHFGYGAPPPPSGAPPYGGYRGGGGGYGPPPPPPRTAVDEYHHAVNVVRSMAQSLREVESILPGGQRESYEAPSHSGDAGDEDNPLQVVEAGPAKIVVSKQDGSLRAFETGFANLPSIMKWVGEQAEAVRKSNDGRQQAQPQRQQLPPGYVEVTPGYRPPDGYIAVPVDQDHLPPPPTHVPPPLHSQPQQAPQAQPAWGEMPQQPWSGGGFVDRGE